MNITQKCCSEKPVISLGINEKLCKSHFIDYFEQKVFKTIRQFDLIGKEEKIGVAVSGGKDSLTILSLIHRLSLQNPKIGVEAIAIDEGIKGYRDKSLLKANELCGKLGINLNVFSYKEEFGMELDEILKVLTIKPCSICGVFRRYLLNKKSRELGFTLLATGHNLDDEAQSIMMNQMKNNVSASARLGPKVGIIEDSRFVQRIKPLYFCTEKEVTTYAFINGLMDDFNECPNAVHSYRAGIRDMLNDFENKFAGTKHSIVNSFLETLPLLQKQYTQNHIEIKSCDNCGEPSAKEICSACNYAERLKQKAELSQIKK